MILKLMKMLDYLKDAQLVASIQQFFGIKIYYDRNDKAFQEGERKYTKIDDSEENYIATCRIKKINGYDASSKRLNAHARQISRLLEQGTNESAINTKHKETSTPSNNPNYAIANSFWYYTFIFGTELGDEIFYSTFIPFLFWNIDGAVGQRVVLVWAIVMTIGIINL